MSDLRDRHQSSRRPYPPKAPGKLHRGQPRCSGTFAGARLQGPPRNPSGDESERLGRRSRVSSPGSAAPNRPCWRLVHQVFVTFATNVGCAVPPDPAVPARPTNGSPLVARGANGPSSAARSLVRSFPAPAIFDLMLVRGIWAGIGNAESVAIDSADLISHIYFESRKSLYFQCVTDGFKQKKIL